MLEDMRPAGIPPRGALPFWGCCMPRLAIRRAVAPAAGDPPAAPPPAKFSALKEGPAALPASG